MKKGRLSKEEMRFITASIDHMTVDDIAKQLSRDPDSIELFVKKKLKKGANLEEIAAFELEDRPYWRELQSQFTDEELELFQYHWSRIISQFRDDVLPTEELQVVDVIKLEILMNRALKSNKDNILEINVLDKMVREERGVDKEQRDTDFIMNMERQIIGLRASQESLNRDYRELQTKKAAILREMKGTREQRIKRLEDSKQSFVAWIAHMMQNPEIMKEYGMEMEKMRLAMIKEKERLAAYHKYEDGQVDQPFLTPDTVKEE
jgi:hypothetical protein